VAFGETNGTICANERCSPKWVVDPGCEIAAVNQQELKQQTSLWDTTGEGLTKLPQHDPVVRRWPTGQETWLGAEFCS